MHTFIYQISAYETTKQLSKKHKSGILIAPAVQRRLHRFGK